MPKALDLTGQRFGTLVAVSISGSQGGRNVWLCQCDCGGVRHELAKHLSRGVVKNCGPDCLIPKPYRGPAHNRKDLTGKVFHRLTVLREVEMVTCYESGPKTQYLCRCECGKEFKVHGSSLTTGNTKSCGCWSRDMAADRVRTHGLSRTRVHRIWQAMLNRCRNSNTPDYEYWGGRGITVCERWSKFENFLEDMGHPPAGFSIDRIDNNRNYEPENCRWASKIEQARNTRGNRLISFNGETLCLIEWANRLGLEQSSLRERLEKWPIEKALTTPKQYKGAIWQQV